MKLLQLDRSGDVPRIKEVEVEIGTAAPQTSIQKSIPFFISGNFIQAGDAVTLFFPNGLRIDGYALHTDTAATLALDVRAVSPEDMPSDETDRIDGSAPPTLSAENYVSDNVLEGWSRMVPENRVIVARVTSVTGNVRNVTLQFDVVEGVNGFPLLWFTAPSEENVLSYTTPSVIYGETSVEEYPTYTHTPNVAVIPTNYFSASDVNEYPTYTHVPDQIGTPAAVLFSANSVVEYPTYVQAAFSTLTINAGADDTQTQWVKYSRTITPSTGAAPFEFVVTGLPTGLTAAGNGTSVIISGVPEVTGNFSISVQVTDRAGRTASDSYNLTLSAGNRIPVIETTVSSNFLVIGDGILRGYNFGDSAGVLMVDGVDHTATVITWSNTEIEFAVPSTTNPSDIYVTAFGQNSNTVSRQILAK